jgi:hypothetical protein
MQSVLLQLSQQITATHECISLKFGLRNERKLNLKPQSAKAKGRKLQQWVRDQILQRFPTLTTDDVRSTSMGAGGEDVQLSTQARSLVTYTIECKNRKAIAVYKDYEQAKTHGLIEPLVILKQNLSKPLALVDAEHFLDLVQRVKDLQHQIDVLLLVKGKK